MKKVIAVVLALAALVCVVAPVQKAEAQVVYSNYCCDGYGNHRCVMANGPFPIGSSCFCNGQGYGVVCP